MFAIIFDEYGNIYGARFVGYGQTRKEAEDRMRRLVLRDCMECCDEDLGDAVERYVDGGDYMFSPRGQDGCYKVIEMPGAFIPEDNCRSFNERIEKAIELYENERDDADLICQEVCWDLQEYI